MRTIVNKRINGTFLRRNREKIFLKREIEKLSWLVFDHLTSIARILQKFNSSRLSYVYATDYDIYSLQLPL